MVRTYFVALNFSIAPPPKGPVDLGHIVLGPNEADLEPLNVRGHIDAPNVDPIDYKRGFLNTRAKLLSGEIGVWAKVAASFGVQASLSHQKDSGDLVEVKSLQTITFRPQLNYVKSSMMKPEILTFVQTSKYKVPVYMITGLKVARGASVTTKSSEKVDVSLGGTIPVDGAEVGPKLHGTRSTSKSEGFKGSTDFILAFRVQRVVFRDGKIEHKLYTKRAQMMDDEAKVEAGPVDIEIEGLEDGAGQVDSDWEVLGDVREDSDMNDYQVVGASSND